MSKIGDRPQVTLPKALAGRHGIGLDIAARLRLFDAATARQRARQADKGTPPAASRGWTRGALYDRHSSHTG
ncbi:MAG: hypothetical protein OXI64_00745 [Defluviicoccus sp.]|nr:hypothetical protein [Defluviicoccus sp.]